MKQVSEEAVKTLGDYSLPQARCTGCGFDLPASTLVEIYSTEASSWIVAECPSCDCCTPFRLLEGA